MDSDYGSDSEQNNENPDEFKPSFKKMSKNQQIYGDFQYAYEPEVKQDIFSKRMNAYQQFKPGATIETYSSEVQVDLPIFKPKPKLQQDEDDDKPMLGKFSLNSFLNSLSGNDGLREIVEDDNQDSSQNLPEGLNEKIIAYLKLIKLGEIDDDEEQPLNLDNMTYETYMKMNRPKVPKIEPKYKTQEEKDLAKEFNASYGVGFKMLQKMGYKVTKGLGKQETGIQKPVQAVNKKAFTMKDETHPRRQAKKQQSSQNEEEQTQQLSIPEKVFQYRSKDKKINNLFIDLRNTFEKLESQIFNCESQIESFQKEEELNESLKCQSENEVMELAKEIIKLQDLEKNIYSCELYPHLGLHYKLDLLYVRELYDTLLSCDFQMLCQIGQAKIKRLIEVLNNFYLAKSRETLRQFDESTGIENKLHKNLLKRKKYQSKEEVIDLDNLDNEEKIVSIGFEDEEKIQQFVELIIARCILPKVALVVDRVSNIEKISDLRVIDMLELVKRYDKKGTMLKEYVSIKLIPKCKFYLDHVSLEELESNARKLPHQVIFPWLTVIRPEDLDLITFYRRLAGKLWSIENSALFNIVSPWMKFSTQAELSFLQNFYLAPRLLFELQQFNIGQAKVTVLNGLSQYCELLTFRQRQEILQNSLLLQVLEAYKKYKRSMGEKELGKWLSRWKKFTDKLAPGFFQGFFKEYAVTIE